ncbi:CHAT domain-containing protein [Kitasatospora sp. MAP12-15]|uniref:CHAT domain-containing protein n=1 Tax=unclassified Kitasatospora TaxID=2633591 RepID=UPI0024748374|nr:CHAT domain-containing protein [Kitasatospora sp. MAP12-44]MDH6114582.1 CHAT domain-containing protein [Kitasatospora sp. MAP12-44]
MNAAVHILVLPTETGSIDLAQFYLLRHDTWHDVPLATLPKVGLGNVRSGVEQTLRNVAHSTAEGKGADAKSALADKCVEYWNILVPDAVRSAVARALDEQDGPPDLLFHTHTTLEWIPWELLNDGTNWLGVSCRVARLPIVQNGPAVATTHPVQNACNFLGQQVIAADATALYEQWVSTFEAVAASGGTVQQFPSSGLTDYPTLDDLKRARGADIIHLTCHGALDYEGRPILRLDPEDEFLGNINAGTTEHMKFASPGPLVFANACSSAAGAAQGNPTVNVQPGLGASFFDHGASAFVGCVAPVDRGVAMRFAAAFYQHLLADRLPVGEALRRTKEDFERAEADPSWLFYCLYGSPAACFVPPPVPNGDTAS